MAYVIESRAEVDAILSKASDAQIEWVVTRVHTRSNNEAIKKMGISEKGPYAWWNYHDLQACVNFLKREAVMGAVFALENLATDAVHALADALNGRDKRLRVQAAREILSRVVPEKQQHAVNSVLKVEYVNDWRPNTLTESASGSDNGTATSKEVQLAVGGPAVAKNDNGHVNSG